MKVMKKTLSDGSTQYLARPIIDGRKLAVRAKTKSEVERKVAALKEKQRRRRLALPDPDERPDDITYSTLVEKVLSNYQHSPQAKRSMDYNLRRSAKAFGHVLVREMSDEQIGIWLARLDRSTTTKRATLKAMRYALKRAVAWGYRRDNPAAAVEMPREPSYVAHPFDSWEEVLAVAGAATNQRDQALILFASATGLRPQEWQALQWRDIDIATRSLRVNRTIQDGKVVEATAKTRGSLRTVLLTTIALDALRRLPTPLRRDQVIFPGKRRETIDLHAWRRGPWQRALKAAGLDYREPYGMRDTFATLSLADGAPLEWISEQMGHDEIDTTRKHYARWKAPREYAILDALDAARSQTGLKEDSLASEAR